MGKHRVRVPDIGYIVSRKTALAKQIIRQGQNKMSEDLKKKYVDNYLLPKAKRDANIK